MALYKDIVRKIPIPADKKTKQKEYLANGKLPIVDQGHGLIGGYTDDLTRKLICQIPVIVFGDHTKCVKLINFDFGAGADGVKVIQPKDDSLNIKYLYYATKYLILRIRDKGYARHYQFIEKHEIPVPSLPEQLCIVSRIEELFSSLDNAMETLQKTKEQLAVYRQAVLKKVLQSHGESNSILDDVIVNLQNGIAKRKGSDGKDIIVLRLADLDNDRIIESNEMRAITLTKKEQESYILNKGDALIVRVNGSMDRVGRMVIVEKDSSYAFCDHLIRCVFDRSKILPQFAKYLFDDATSRKHIKDNVVSTAGQNTISQGTIKNCPIYLPSLEDQERMVDEIDFRLSMCDSIEQIVDTALAQAEAMRQSILKEAFEGRLA